MATVDLLDTNTAAAVLEESRKLGADFADIFIEHHMRSNMSVLTGNVHEIDKGIDFGIGIRLVYGTKVLYGYTNEKSQDELIRITRLLAATDKRDEKFSSVCNFQILEHVNQHSHQYTLDSDYPDEQKIKYLFDIDRAMRNQGENISQATSMVQERLQKVQIFNTEGLNAKDTRQYCRIMANAIAEDGNERSDGYEAPGGLMGWEFSREVDPKELGENVGRLALTKLNADPCPAGQMPVIIDNGFGGVIFHEACGHLLETTSVAKKASVFHDKMDEMIASECVSAADDGTIENKWGSINIDDEGLPTQRTQLIKNGRLTGFLVDRVGSLKTGYKTTGSGRRQNYQYAPASRMRNTFIEPGNHSLEEMVSSIDHGIYCKKMGGGSVTPGTGEFNFNARESYLVKNGKIDRPLKSATLIGTGPNVLKEISMVGNNFELAPGMCGSVSGAVPTTVGQPAIKVDNILVGGQE